jgi:hypothetical protein
VDVEKSAFCPLRSVVYHANSEHQLMSKKVRFALEEVRFALQDAHIR